MSMTPERAALAQTKVEELKRVAQQRQQVHVDLIIKISKALDKLKTPGGAAALLAGAPTKHGQGGKRALSGTTSAASDKRPRGDVDKRINDIWNKCEKLVRVIRTNQNAHPFLKPVDPVRDCAIDYFNVVKRPMDIGTVTTKLKEKQYKDPYEFCADVRQIWENCRLFNPVNTFVRIQGDALSDEFERRWAESQIGPMWDDMVMQQDPQSIGLDRKLAASARQLLMRVNAASCTEPADPTREMTNIEKRKLSAALGALPDAQLPGVLAILAESLQHSGSDDGEVEVDIDQLDNGTLWRLRAYVDGAAEQAPVAGTGMGEQAGVPMGNGMDAGMDFGME